MIALKFAYLGQRYNGLEYHPNNKTPLPTIEEELWKALKKARFIFPTPNPSLGDGEVNWEGCDYSKSGRTDKGVSAFGQVVGIRVRSNRPLDVVESKTLHAKQQENEPQMNPELASVPFEDEDTGHALHSSFVNAENEDPRSFDHINDEIPYPQLLNRLLPPDIRVLAWCPFPPADFSARFSCKERRYRYFFTNPAFTPTHGPAGVANNTSTVTALGKRIRQGWLDIEAMREGARKFEGLHDFRNFCKLDPSKQMENFERRIFYANIEEVDLRTGPAGYVGLPGFEEHEDLDRTIPESGTAFNSTPKIFAFTLHGSAFLWHQVRCMVSILFLIGQGIESSDLIDKLFDVGQIRGKPMYEMAEDAPLVLWDCIFPHEGGDNQEDALQWVHVGDYTGHAKRPNGTAYQKGNGKHGLGGVVDDLWKVWRQRKMDELLAGMLLDVVVGQGNQDVPARNDRIRATEVKPFSQKVFQGGDSPRLVGKYIPVLEKPRMDAVEDINARYAKRKDFEQEEEVKERGFRTVLDHSVKDSFDQS